jgi:hypothetical protein
MPDQKYSYLELEIHGNRPNEFYSADNTTPVTLQSVQSSNDGFTLRRFYFRALIGTVTPIVVTLSYFYISWYFLRGTAADPKNPTNIGLDGARLSFYAWFIIGTIGINLSSYGLQGAEASMLMERGWGQEMHCNCLCTAMQPGLVLEVG